MIDRHVAKAKSHIDLEKCDKRTAISADMKGAKKRYSRAVRKMFSAIIRREWEVEG